MYKIKGVFDRSYRCFGNLLAGTFMQSIYQYGGVTW